MGVYFFNNYVENSMSIETQKNPTTNSKKEQNPQQKIDFKTINPDFKFTSYIPNEWKIENVSTIDSINIYDPEVLAENNLEKSQIFIRQFKASEFLTLNSVNIIKQESVSINEHEAIRYEIEKKDNIADFPNQPSWRNTKHKLIDIRYTKSDPSIFYVFSYNPLLSEEKFNSLINQLVFDNDSITLSEPLENSVKRITKKPFGIKIEPETSPVQPEKFQGFHTGTDFEILDNEGSSPVNVKVICSGKLLQKKDASGYGGVAIQECDINNEVVTVIYGHLNLESISTEVGDNLNAGDVLGVLGTPGEETDDERKHLHLGIHRGSTINIKGYVNSEEELDDWIDYQSLQI